jgi:hypothetical protein
MKFNLKAPQKSLDKSLLRFRPKEAESRKFTQAFVTLLNKIDNKELEDNQKTHVHDFLREAFYRNTNEINSKGRIDLVVHLGAEKSSPVGLIVEAKSPGNKAEMLSEAKPNASPTATKVRRRCGCDMRRTRGSSFVAGRSAADERFSGEAVQRQDCEQQQADTPSPVLQAFGDRHRAHGAF